MRLNRQGVLPLSITMPALRSNGSRIIHPSLSRIEVRSKFCARRCWVGFHRTAFSVRNPAQRRAPRVTAGSSIPLTGTRSFVRGIPIWATLVGLEHNGELIAGVAHLPAMKQTFRAPARRRRFPGRPPHPCFYRGQSQRGPRLLFEHFLVRQGGPYATVPQADQANGAAARLRRFLRFRPGGAGLRRSDGRARRACLGRWPLWSPSSRKPAAR